MTDESALRQRARAAIQAGKLPDRRPERMWGGPGVGANCAICGEPAKPDEAELELEFDRRGADPGQRSYHVHIRCFAAWELERQAGRHQGSGISISDPVQLAVPRPEGPEVMPSAAVTRRVLPVNANDGTMNGHERGPNSKRDQP